MHRRKPCHGHRRVTSSIPSQLPDGRSVQLKSLAPSFEWISFEEVDEKIKAITKAFISVGIKPKDKLVLILETRSEWSLVAHSAFRMGVTLCTLYSTLGQDGIIHSLNEVEATHLICNEDAVQQFLKVIDRVPFITHIITVGKTDDRTVSCPGRNEVWVVSLEDLEKSSAGIVSSKLPHPQPDDLTLIMYTSGTTGIPKGVMFNQKHLVTGFINMDSLARMWNLGKDPLYLAYLPLAHIFEFLLELLCFNYGIPVAFSSSSTAFDFCPGLATGTSGDATVCKPTLMIAVPLILDKLTSAIKEQVGAKGPFTLNLFQWAVNYKTFWTYLGFKCPLITKLLFKKTKSMLGGSVETLIFGSAPCSPETQQFARAVFDLDLLQVYGTTEVMATSCTDPYGTFQMRFSGQLTGGVTVSLEEWSDGCYSPNDKPHARGEVLIKADHISVGYYKKPAETMESFYADEDGTRWFKSGDIALIHAKYGTIQIIDRKKDLVKLPNGEFVSLGKIESCLKRNQFIENICVCNHPNRNWLAAIILPNRTNLIKFSEEIKAIKSVPNGIHSNGSTKKVNFEDICENSEIISKVLESIQKSGSEAGLKKIEIPVKIFLSSEEWTPSNGLVTASFKLRRKQVFIHHKELIEKMFE